MSDTLSEQLGPAAQNVEETMGSLVDTALGPDDDSGRGTIMAATGGGMGLAAGMGGSGGGPELPGSGPPPEGDGGDEMVLGGGESSDKRGSATRFMGDY